MNRAVRRVDACAFCGVACCPNGHPLLHCAHCDLVAYCGKEHQNYHWKRHKLICKTFLSSNSRPSSSCSSSTSIASTSNHVNVIHQEMIDPDIQIIEHNNEDLPAPIRLPRSSRKRQQEEGNGENGGIGGNGDNGGTGDNRENGHIRRIFKDHSRNALFRTTLQEHLKMLASSGLALNQHQAIALRLRYIAEHVIRALNEFGWAVVDNFLGSAHCKHTFGEMERLYQRGLFSAGQLMEQKKDGSSSQAEDIRSDKIYWFDNSEERATDAVTIRLLVSMIDSIIVHFSNRIPPYTISGRSRAMIAVYPGNGTRYVKHVDNPVKDGRCITSIYYCNENWKLNEHGGTLRLYPDTSVIPMDIDPQADRLVFFWSDRRNPHEVLPVFRHRYAITIWYFDHAEKMAAIERRKRETESSNRQTEPMGKSSTASTVTKKTTLNLRSDGVLGMVLTEEITAAASSSSPPIDHQHDDDPSSSSPPDEHEHDDDPSSSSAGPPERLPDLSGAYRQMNRARLRAQYPPPGDATISSSSSIAQRHNSISDDDDNDNDDVDSSASCSDLQSHHSVPEYHI